MLKIFLGCLASVLVTNVTGQINRQPDGFKLITTDVENFWQAFDIFKQDTTQNPFAEYLRNGTQGLQHFKEHRIRDSAHFKKIIRLEMDYLEKVRPSTVNPQVIRPRLEKYFKEFQRIYAEAEFPDIYFVIGQFNSGITTSLTEIMVGAELFSDTVVSTSRGDRSTSPEKLPVYITCGLAYFNQKPAHTGYTILRQSIVNGSADFLATLALGIDKEIILQQENYIYGEQHEESLVKEFLKEQNTDNFSNWFYNRSTKGRPSNLGFWIGYKITQAYYENEPDKTKAIKEIMKINDFDKFLLLSGYVEPFRHN
jgi:hypothetical protein